MENQSSEQDIEQPRKDHDPIDSAEQRIIDGFTHFKLNNF
ncbi:hypothetical protein A2U01_0054666, partial [Trifolium medium]|nr:hypothetical protein [Trifolium medium]